MTDKRTIFTVVIFLGALALVGMGGVIYLTGQKIEPTNIAVVAGLAGTAMGALATLLASTKSAADVVEPPQPVQVMNQGQGEAVPTAPVAGVALPPAGPLP